MSLSMLNNIQYQVKPGIEMKMGFTGLNSVFLNLISEINKYKLWTFQRLQLLKFPKTLTKTNHLPNRKENFNIYLRLYILWSQGNKNKNVNQK